MKIQLIHTYQDIISIENLFAAWQEFLQNKKLKTDVQQFKRRLMDNIVALHQDLIAKTYRHGGYHEFRISDPKPRVIHKASVRDRLLHHAIYRILYPFFDRTFIADSFSCRVNKGTHAALDRFKRMSNQMSRNNTRTCWILKCDIKKFFASIDQTILLNILEQYIPDVDILWLLGNIVGSFQTTEKTGLPLGNLTSQLLVNIYMNEFDQYIKHKLKATHYIRYADDFVILSRDKQWLELCLLRIHYFLQERLKLNLHPAKVSIKTFASGVDFLGWVHFPTHRVLRSATKKRMFRRIMEKLEEATIQSYLGLLSHGNTAQLQNEIKTRHWLYQSDA